MGSIYNPPASSGGGGAATSALSITKTGNWRYNPLWTLVAPRNVDCGGFSAIPGKWVDNIIYNEGNTLFNPKTSALSFDDLAGVINSYSPSTMAALTTLSAPALTYVGGNYSPNTMAALNTLSAPALAYVGGNYSPNTMAALNTLSAPALVYVAGAYNPNTMAALTTLSAPALAYVVSSYGPSMMAALTTINLPAIKYLGSISINSGTAALSSFSLGATLLQIAGNVVLSSCALNQANVDGILASLVALDGTGGTTLYTGAKTVTITGTSSAPSAAGLVNKAILQARGITVTTN